MRWSPVLPLLGLLACARLPERDPALVHEQARTRPAPPGHDERAAERDAMVTRQIEARGISDPAVLTAMRAVPRHRFVPEDQRARAYHDRPLPIGHDQTISQPAIVALMTQELALKGHEKVLEIGTGSGYQAAVLAEIVPAVWSIEIVEPLARQAETTLHALGYGDRVHVRAGDGYRGWPEEAPFDAILLTAAPNHVPRPLLDQLKVGGRLIAPVGARLQWLVLVEKTAGGLRRRRLEAVRFVPMTGEAQEKRGR